MLDLTPNAVPNQKSILEHVERGEFDLIWGKVTSDHDGHHGEFYVFADALKIDGVRVNVTAETQQKIADSLDCMLLTPKLADLIWEQREVTLSPNLVRPFSVTNAGMLAHSKMIDEALAKLGNPEGLICTVGKHWVVDNGLLPLRKIVGVPVAMNYGWHFAGQTFLGQGFEITATRLQTAEGRLVRLVQGKGTKHNMLHGDYSQTCVLVSLNCRIDDTDMRLDEVLKDPKLAPLANFGGILHVLRQPGV